MITFTALSFYLHGNAYFGFLFLPMSLVQMLAYNGLRRFSGWEYNHSAAELITGAAYAMYVEIELLGA